MSDEASGRSKPRFDPTINYGHILTAATFIAAGLAAFLGMEIELQNLDQRVIKIEAALQQLANVLVVTATRRAPKGDGAEGRPPSTTLADF